VKVKASLPRQVEQFLRGVDLGCQPLVVAVSGGPDSVALLHALVSRQFPNLVIAHLNHQLRGRDSDADEHFVHELHDTLKAQAAAGLELRCDRADVAAHARSEGDNLESVARRLRYAWLVRVARSVDAQFVATGHTADDQAETVLHRLLRGTGLKGLRGIANRRNLAPGVEVLRPLLKVTRADVLAYLEAEGQAFRHDASNDDRSYTRNRIRHELLPYLVQHYNPAIASVLGRLAEQAAQAYEYQETLAGDLLAEAERWRAGRLLVFAAARLTGQPRWLVREVFRLIWIREGWPLGAMGFREWDRLAAVALGQVPAVDLPGGIRAQRHQHVIQVGFHNKPV
jgi:tRNA(Ile)-lysidine synthase